MAEQYFTASSNGRVDDVLRFYDPDFYRATPREQWRDTLVALQARLGRSKSHTATGWNAFRPFGGNSFAVRLTYQVEYEHGSGIETVVIKVP